MIPQDIVISPDVIEKIKNEFIDLNLRSYWSNMKYKRLVFDSKEGIIIEEIKKLLVGAHKLIVEKVHKEILNSARFSSSGKFIEIKDAKKYSHNKINNLLLNLTMLTGSKILNIEDVTVKNLIIPKFDDLKEIELLNIKESIKPPSNSKIFNAERTIDLFLNDDFKIHEILLHYFINTKSLIICDKYVLHKNRDNNNKCGYDLFFEILRKCENLKELEIWTKFDHKNVEDFATKNELISDLNKYTKENKPDLKFTICVALGSQHKRHIYTDYFDIKSDVGLNFLNMQYKVNKSVTDIVIEERTSKINQSIKEDKNSIKSKNRVLYKN
ncbi:MAG: hypothetical protein ACOYN6_00065 [Ignavibacteria bacterium]